MQDEGCNVIDIGMVGTEEIYFATSHLDVDGGIEVTTSHNPINYNGMKLVSEQSKPVSGDTGLHEIQEIAEQAPRTNESDAAQETKGQYAKVSILEDYVEHLLNYIEPGNIRPLKLVVNSGNGAAGHVIDTLEKNLMNCLCRLSLSSCIISPMLHFQTGNLTPWCRKIERIPVTW